MKKKLILALSIMAALLVVGVAAAWIFIGNVVKAGVETAGPMITKTQVTLGGASVSILGGSGTISDFVLKNPEGFKSAEAIKVGKVSLALSPASVLSDKVVVRSIIVEGPEITYEAALGGSNLGKILENVQAAAAALGSGTNAPADSGAGKKLQVNEFIVRGARVQVAATALGGKGATVPLPEIRLQNLGSSSDGITPAALTAEAFQAIVEGTVKAVGQNAIAIGKDAGATAKDLGADGAAQVKKASGAVKNIFRRD